MTMIVSPPADSMAVDVMTRRGVRDAIRGIWCEVAKERQKRGAWIDDVNPVPGIIMTCEALECFLIPAVFLDDMSPQVAPFFTTQDEAYTVLKAWLNEALELQRGTPFSGAPYLDFSTDPEPAQHPQILDAASFLTTALLHFMKVFEKQLFQDQSGIQNEMRTVLNSCVEFLEHCFVADKRKNGAAPSGSGWTWGPNSEPVPYLYFTYTAMDAMSDLRDPRYGSIVADDVKARLDGYVQLAQKWLIESYVDSDNSVTSTLIKIGAFAISPYYNLWALVGVLSQPGADVQQDSYVDAVKLLRSVLEKPELFERDLKIGIDVSLKERAGASTMKWPDRAFLPLLLKVQCMVAAQTGRTAAEIGAEDTWARLSANRSNGRLLWEKDNYRLYYTERVVEAMVRWYKVLPPVSLDDPPGTPSTDRGDSSIEALATGLGQAIVQQLKTACAQEMHTTPLPSAVVPAVFDFLEAEVASRLPLIREDQRGQRKLELDEARNAPTWASKFARLLHEAETIDVHVRIDEQERRKVARASNGQHRPESNSDKS